MVASPRVEAAVYRLSVGVVKASLRLMGWRVLIAGEERLPRSGPAVLACNHVSYLDPLMIGYAAEQQGRAVHFLAKEELFARRALGWLLRTVGQISVDRYGHPEQSLAPAVAVLRRGGIVGMFPEGSISTSFVPGEGKTGAARMALEAPAPLVPVALWGGQRLITKGRPRNFQRGVALMVRVGEPVPYEVGEDPAAVTERLMAAIADLAEEAWRAYPQAPAGPRDRWWIPRHLGGTAPTVHQAADARREQDTERRRRRQAAGGPNRA